MTRPIKCTDCNKDLTGSSPIVIDHYFYCNECAHFHFQRARDEVRASLKKRGVPSLRDSIREMFKKPQIRHTAAANIRIGGEPVLKRG